MNKRLLLLAASHAAAIALGFGLGVYALPILIAPAAPSATEIASQASAASFKGQFRRDLKDSDALHWGEGTVSITARSMALSGKLAPGPDYKLYLSPQFVETEADFNRLKSSMVRVGDVKTFENFIVPVPAAVDPSRYNTVIVWCEHLLSSLHRPSTASRFGTCILGGCAKTGWIWPGAGPDTVNKPGQFLVSNKAAAQYQRAQAAI